MDLVDDVVFVVLVVGLGVVAAVSLYRKHK